MCGLFAVIPTTSISADLALKLRFLIRTLAVQNDSRGGHSWGMWTPAYLPYKGLGRMSDNLDSLTYFSDLWKPKKGDWIAGHTRFGTHGARTAENSHPYVHGSLTLAHNGVVSVKVDDAEVKAHPVDSGQLCIAISKYGMEEALKNTTGQMGLLFSDANRKLFAYRSDQVLHFAACEWGYAVSSDKNHLRFSMDFCGFQDATIADFTESMVSAPWYEDFEPFKVKTGGLTKYTAPAWNSGYYGGARGWEGDDDYSGYPTSTGARIYKDGGWQTVPAGSAKSNSIPGKTTGPVSDYEIKLANGIIKTVAGAEKGGTLSRAELDGVLDAMDRGEVPAQADLDKMGLVTPLKVMDQFKKEPLRLFTDPNGKEYTFDPSASCDNCEAACDEDGGFFFDQEVPNIPLCFCKKCLEDLKIRGFVSVR